MTAAIERAVPVYALSPEYLTQFFNQYQTPESYRYGSPKMRTIWSERHRWKKARNIWIAAAEVQMDVGLVSHDELQDFIAHRDEIDIPTILRREMDSNDLRHTDHETAAAISQYADVVPIGTRILHQGMTSEDILSNVEILQTHEAFALINEKLERVIAAFEAKAEEYQDITTAGYDGHRVLPSSIKMGERFRQYADDFRLDMDFLHFVKSIVKGKGMKGAVGTSASFARLLEKTGMTPEEHERRIMEKLGLEVTIVTGQTSPRKYTLLTILALYSMAQSCHKYAEDLKLLQSSPIDEAAGRRRKVSSTAMPGKKSNPITAETIQALARELPGKVISAWESAAKATLERGMEDSAGKRSYLPEAFLIIDDILEKTENSVKGLRINQEAIQRNLARFSLLCNGRETLETLISQPQGVIFQRDQFAPIESKLAQTLREFEEKIREYRDLVTTAYTHYQAAEPIPMGYRLARYAQDLLIDLLFLRFVQEKVIGSDASFDKYRLLVTSALSSIAQTCHQYAGDLAVLQSSGFDEVLSSNIPPRKIQKITRRFAGKLVDPFVATLDEPLESTPDDIEWETMMLKEDITAIADVLDDVASTTQGFTANTESIRRNLEQFGPFMALEIIMAEFTRKGGNRQEAHRILIELAQTAWKAVEEGESNPLIELVKQDLRITEFLPPEEIDTLFASITTHVGDAHERCDRFIEKELKPALGQA